MSNFWWSFLTLPQLPDPIKTKTSFWDPNFNPTVKKSNQFRVHWYFHFREWCEMKDMKPTMLCDWSVESWSPPGGIPGSCFKLTSPDMLMISSSPKLGTYTVWKHKKYMYIHWIQGGGLFGGRLLAYHFFPWARNWIWISLWQPVIGKCTHNFPKNNGSKTLYLTIRTWSENECIARG